MAEIYLLSQTLFWKFDSNIRLVGVDDSVNYVIIMLLLYKSRQIQFYSKYSGTFL